jgi:hypothetical protein
MTTKERMLAFYRRKKLDRMPVAAYDFLIPRGGTERQLRNQGLGLIKWCPVSPLISPAFLSLGGDVKNVSVTVEELWEDGEKSLLRRFATPVGTVCEKYREDKEYGSKWIKKHLIENVSDYPIVKYIVENSVVRDNAEEFARLQDDIGEDGVVLGMMDRSPFQKVMWEMTGPERMLLDLYDNTAVVEDLLLAVEKKLDETYKVAAACKADVIWSPDNITVDLNSPSIFRKYHLPFYNKCGAVLHKNGKAYVVHMDGKLNPLKDLIKEADVDVIESFSVPMAGGDYPIRDALEHWSSKSIAANVVASLCMKEQEEIRRNMRELLTDVSGKENFMLQVSEDLPHGFWQKGLPLILDTIFEKRA